MKHHITLLGGQLMPILLGIREFAPDIVYLLCSRESEKGAAAIKKMANPVKVKEIQVEAFNYGAIKKACEAILPLIMEGDELNVNLTGGTKIMALACQAFVLEHQLKGFYINQNNTVLAIPGYQTVPVKEKLSINDFFALSGHQHYTVEHVADYNAQDRTAAAAIEAFAPTPQYKDIMAHIRRTFKDQTIPANGNETFGKDDRLRYKWDDKEVEIFIDRKSKHRFTSEKIMDLFFNAAWWELIVALALEKNLKPQELFMKVKLPYISDKGTDKNEIDILISHNNKLIFIECKSGTVKNADVQKMKSIKQTYGGLVSKSILVSLYPPGDAIQERCRELDIVVFTGMAKNFNQLAAIIQKLGKSPSL